VAEAIQRDSRRLTSRCAAVSCTIADLEANTNAGSDIGTVVDGCALRLESRGGETGGVENASNRVRVAEREGLPPHEWRRQQDDAAEGLPRRIVGERSDQDRTAHRMANEDGTSSSRANWRVSVAFQPA
jgi:hypothetical protein